MPDEKINAKKILAVLEKHRAELKGLGVKKIGLFGSYLDTEKKKKNDIDFLVEFSEPSFDNYSDLKILLEKLFRKKVDLVLEKNLKPSLENVKEKAVYAKAV